MDLKKKSSTAAWSGEANYPDEIKERTISLKVLKVGNMREKKEGRLI